ncbi:hypothetical protein F5890DRAFT_473404 [Lentinula detonsa]|uniref:Secreted protein n=1 Tax=Lentinula detonsa TaxID=2804962 RepID=A0AA38UVV3_9AGAR|nr:hypothetical protein F5890DRAFT_473404 [Lentinula detonsa]
MSVRLIPCAYNLLCFLTTHLYWTANAFDHFSLLPFSSIPCICIYFDNKSPLILPSHPAECTSYRTLFFQTACSMRSINPCPTHCYVAFTWSFGLVPRTSPSLRSGVSANFPKTGISVTRLLIDNMLYLAHQTHIACSFVIVTRHYPDCTHIHGWKTFSLCPERQ